MEEYQKLKLLGTGTYGKCYLVRHKLSNKNYVIKQISISDLDQKQQQQSIKQVQILSSLNHPYIVQFSNYFISNDGFLNIVMSYADGGDLAKKILDCKNWKQKINQQTILNWFTQICLALKHVHDKKIIHRDLKSQNIFLTKEGTVKLGDFGIARSLKLTLQKIKTVVGTPFYMSPEICENKEYSLKTDIWSLGVVLYEMCTLKQPFKSNSLAGLALQITQGSYARLPATTNKYLKKLINEMLQVNPDKRPSINQILSNPLISARIKKFLSNQSIEKEFTNNCLSSRWLSIKDNNTQNFEQSHKFCQVGINDLSTEFVSMQAYIFPIQTPQHLNKDFSNLFKQNCSAQKQNNKERKNNNNKKSQLRRRQISEPNLTPKLFNKLDNHDKQKKIKQNNSLINLQKKKQIKNQGQKIALKKKCQKNDFQLGNFLEEIKQIRSEVVDLHNQLSYRSQEQDHSLDCRSSYDQSILNTLEEIILQNVGKDKFIQLENLVQKNLGFSQDLGQSRGLISLWYGLKFIH